MDCLICQTKLELSKLLTIDNRTHLRTFCPKCRQSKYIEQTEYIKGIFKDVPIEESRKVKLSKQQELGL